MGVTVLNGDCRSILPTLSAESVHCCVTSPPYFGLRDYGHAEQMGLEQTPEEYVARMVGVFHEVRRVLREDGTLWLNIGDSYAHSLRQSPNKSGDKQNTNAGSIRRGFGPIAVGMKEKDLIGIPWLLAFALRADGWYLRSEIIWNKPNCMPESVTDRPTCAHEKIFLLSKSARYYYDADAIAEPAIYSGLTGQDASGFKDAKTFAGKHRDKQRGHGRRNQGFNERWDAMSKEEQCSGTRNKRNVWTVPVSGFPEAHFATFPPDLIEPCIKAGCPADGMVLDPFGGAGTTGLVADRLGRNATLIELNETYCGIARKRIYNDAPLFASVS